MICAPIVEEALFRGAVMRGLLSKMAAVWAIGIQAVLFGAAHFDPDFGRESIGLIIALSVAGVGLGLGCYLLRRLGPVIIAHAVMNAVAITVCPEPMSMSSPHADASASCCIVGSSTPGGSARSVRTPAAGGASAPSASTA